MKLVIFGITCFAVFWITAYTVNFARWSWRKKNRRGAVGLMIIAFFTAIFPISLLVWRTFLQK